jgi:hypothetical protein
MSVASVAQLLLEQSSGGGQVDEITAGDGIGVDEVTTGVFEITNTGVLEITAGDGIDITETSAGVFEIVNTASAPTQSTFSIGATTALSPVNTLFQVITAANNVVPPAGLYIVTIFFILESYNAAGASSAGIGNIELEFYYFVNGGAINYIYPTITAGGQSQIFIQGQTVVECNGVGYFGCQGTVLTFTGNATQSAVRAPFATFPPNITFTKIG